MRDDVVFRPVILYDLHTIGKKGKTKALAAFGFIALEKVYQLAAVGIVVSTIAMRIKAHTP